MGLTTIDFSNIFLKDEIGNVCTTQEDSHDIAALTPNGDVFVVCDGMGGHAGGKKASSLAVENIIAYLKKKKYPDPLQALDEALQFANMQILGYASQYSEFKGMGTTACILLLQGNKAYIAHVGDSRIYLYLGKEKQLHRITKDHSFVQTLIDSGEITDEEAEHHPNKNRILKALGIKPELQPTFNKPDEPILPKNRDVFLICSDGLNSMISDNTIKNVLSSNGTIEQKGDMLIKLALEGENKQQPGGQDNITVELIQIDNSPWKKRVFTSFNPISKTQVSVSKSRNLMIRIAVLIAFLCIVGLGMAYYIHEKSKEQKIERLTKIQQEVNGLDKQISQKKSEHNKAIHDLEDAKYTKNDSLIKIYKKIESTKNKELYDLEVKHNSAKEKLDKLKETFTMDSINNAEKKFNMPTIP